MTKAKQRSKKPEKSIATKEHIVTEGKTPIAAMETGETVSMTSPGPAPALTTPLTGPTTVPVISDTFSVPSVKTAAKPCFQAEIQSMMYAFGDVRRPSPQSARLIQEIVHRQISNLVVQTADVTLLRGGKFMHTEDIKFLMRKDKEKLKKLNLYLSFKENKQKVVKQASQDEDELIGAYAGSKRRRPSDGGSIFEPRDETNLFGDEAYDQKKERMERAERLSRTLDTQQYMEFVECRQANFNKKAGKFKEWLDYANLTELKPSTPIMEVFSYLAYETVGQIVELALLVKKDMERSDELTAVMPLLRDNNASKISLPFINTPSLSTSRSSTPTPPSTPTTPTNGGAPSFPTNGTTMTTGIASSSTPQMNSTSFPKTTKSKKRKTKSCSANSIDLYSDCLQPHHIREALRRYCTTIGPLAAFSTSVKSTPLYRALCL